MTRRPALRHATLPRPAALLAVLAWLFALAPLPAAAADAQDDRQLIDSKESLYNNIYIYKEKNIVYLTFGYNKAIFFESAFNTEDERDLPVPYTRYMTAGLAYARNLGSALEIGFGGGRTAWYLHRFLPDMPITAVEIDPVVVALSHTYFGIKDEPNFNVVNEDGRQFLTHADHKYDLILLDAFHGPFIPFHLLTKEYYEQVKLHLAEGGVVLQNMDPDNKLFDATAKTIGSVFPQMDFYFVEGNAVIAAYDGPRPKDDLMRLAQERQAALKLRYSLPELVGKRRGLDVVAPALDASATLLTDDFAPVEALKAEEKHNREWPTQSAEP